MRTVLRAHCLENGGFATRQHVAHPAHEAEGEPLMQQPLLAQVAPATQVAGLTGVQAVGSVWPMVVVVAVEPVMARQKMNQSIFQEETLMASDI